MNTLNPSDLIALCSLFLACFTTLIGAILWYAQSEKKKYASERDFQHIRNNQKSISDGIAMLTKDIEDQMNEIGRDILEIKINLGIQSKKE
ncbi:hypothetical protein [uncultured Nostoc sp.]|uniref:hypothetical protein n=1 Tax=uncultured Nostoc sp. TaxID=340711 RepID=UPI0035CC3AF3